MRAIVRAGIDSRDSSNDLPAEVLVRVLQAATLSLIDSAERGWDGNAELASAAVLRSAGVLAAGGDPDGQ